MLNIATKTDGVSTLSAAEFNSYMQELENMVTLSGQTLSGSIQQQLANALAIYAGAGSSYVDSGTANAYVLGVEGVQVAPPSYTPGMMVRFKAGNSNTGASTVNVAGLGVVPIRTNAGVAVTSGVIVAGAIIALWYNAAGGYFELASTSTTSSTVSNAYVGGTSTGSANAQVVATLSPTGYTLASGNIVVFKAGYSNTGATTLNASSTGVTNIYKQSASGVTPLVGGEIIAGTMVLLIYDGTEYLLINPSSSNNLIKAWGVFTGGSSGTAPSLAAGSGIASITRNSTGNYTITLNSGVVPDTSYGVLVNLASGSGYNTASAMTYLYTINSTTSLTLAIGGLTVSVGGVSYDVSGFTIEILHN